MVHGRDSEEQGPPVLGHGVDNRTGVETSHDDSRATCVQGPEQTPRTARARGTAEARGRAGPQVSSPRPTAATRRLRAGSHASAPPPSVRPVVPEVKPMSAGASGRTASMS